MSKEYDNVVECPHCQGSVGIKEKKVTKGMFTIMMLECPFCEGELLYRSDGVCIANEEGAFEVLMEDGEVLGSSEDEFFDWDEFMETVTENMLLEDKSINSEIYSKATPEVSAMSVYELQYNVDVLDDEILIEELDHISRYSDYAFPQDVHDTITFFRNATFLSKPARKLLEDCYILTWASGTMEMQ